MELLPHDLQTRVDAACCAMGLYSKGREAVEYIICREGACKSGGLISACGGTGKTCIIAALLAAVGGKTLFVASIGRIHNLIVHLKKSQESPTAFQWPAASPSDAKLANSEASLVLMVPWEDCDTLPAQLKGFGWDRIILGDHASVPGPDDGDDDFDGCVQAQIQARFDWASGIGSDVSKRWVFSGIWFVSLWTNLLPPVAWAARSAGLPDEAAFRKHWDSIFKMSKPAPWRSELAETPLSMAVQQEGWSLPNLGHWGVPPKVWAPATAAMTQRLLDLWIECGQSDENYMENMEVQNIGLGLLLAPGRDKGYGNYECSVALTRLWKFAHDLPMIPDDERTEVAGRVVEAATWAWQKAADARQRVALA